MPSHRGGEAQEPEGQVPGAHPGDDEETGVVDDEAEADLAPGHPSSDELIPWRSLPGGGYEDWNHEQTFFRPGEVTLLRAGSIPAPGARCQIAAPLANTEE